MLDRMPEPDLVAWNALISGFCTSGFDKEVLELFLEVFVVGLKPNVSTLASVIPVCSRLGFLNVGKSLHGFAIKSGFRVKKAIDLNLNVCNALVAFYLSYGKMDSAFILFNRMNRPDIVSWNILLSGCLHIGQAGVAVLLFHHMKQEDVGFDVVTLKSLLSTCSESGDLMLGGSIQGYAIKTGFDSDVSLTNALISMYMKCGDLESGTFLFENMPSRNVISWNALLTGYCHLNTPCDITVFVRRMTEEKQKPNHITLLNLLQSCRTILQGKATHAYAVKRELMQEAPLLTSLMLMYARFGNAKSCLFIFQKGQDRNLSMWNAVISAHLKLNDAISAFSFFIDLLRWEIQPDYVTFLSVISSCVQINNLIVNDSMFAYLIRKGFDKYVTINNALIDLYARCGNISVARKLFELSPEKDFVSWSVMINGYGLHGDAEAALALLSHMRLSGKNCIPVNDK